MPLIERRHLLPGAAAFVATVTVALLGLTAGAEEPPAPPPKEVAGGEHGGPRDRRADPPSYKIVERAGVRVGFIGVTTDETPTWLLPEYKREYRFRDISETVNR